MAENLHEEHRKRMKERFNQNGLKSFQPHEILEMALYYCIPYKDTNALAHDLLSRYGSINQLLKTDPQYLMEIKGVGGNTATFLSFLKQFVEYYVSQEDTEKLNLKKHSACVEFVKKQLRYQEKEQLLVLCLDSQMYYIRHDILSTGMVNQTSVNIRSIVNHALKFNSTGVVIAHNHPSGTPEPTIEDNVLTETLYKALNYVEISLLDHIVIAGNEYYSYFKDGKIEQLQDKFNTEKSARMLQNIGGFLL